MLFPWIAFECLLALTRHHEAAICGSDAAVHLMNVRFKVRSDSYHSIAVGCPALNICTSIDLFNSNIIRPLSELHFGLRQR